jgi:hypothetical protein
MVVEREAGKEPYGAVIHGGYDSHYRKLDLNSVMTEPGVNGCNLIGKSRGQSIHDPLSLRL